MKKLLFLPLLAIPMLRTAVGQTGIKTALSVVKTVSGLAEETVEKS